MNASEVAKILKSSGQPMTLTHATLGTFDPISGTTSGSVTTASTVYGVTDNYRLSDANASGSLILTGDKKAYISATVPPSVGDTLTIMGKVWTIISFDEESPQGAALLFTCQIRK